MPGRPRRAAPRRARAGDRRPGSRAGFAISVCSASISSERNSMTSPVSRLIRWSWCSRGAPLVAGAAVPELETLDDALGLEELDGAVDRRQRDAVVDRGGAAVQLDHVRMVRGLAEDAGDDPALAGHAQAFGAAGALDARCRSGGQVSLRVRPSRAPRRRSLLRVGIRSAAGPVHRSLEGPAHGDGGGAAAVRPGVVALPPADLAEAAAAIKRRAPGALPSSTSRWTRAHARPARGVWRWWREERARMAAAARPAAIATERISASSAALRDRMKPAGSTAAAEEEPIGEDVPLGERALEFERVPGPGEGLGMDLGEPRGVAARQRRDPGGGRRGGTASPAASSARQPAGPAGRASGPRR